MNTSDKSALDQALYGPTMFRAQTALDGLVDLERLVRVVLSRKWRIAAVAVATAGLAAAYAVSLPTSYASNAKVMINTREGNLIDLGLAVSGLPTNPTAIASEFEVLNSAEIIGQVVDRLDLVDDPEFNAALREPSELDLAIAEAIDSAKTYVVDLVSRIVPIGETAEETTDPDVAAALLRQKVAATLTDKVKIEQLGAASAVFQITAESEDRAKAAAIANAIAQQYLENQLRVKLEASRRASDWLSDRVSELRAAADAAEAELKSHASTMAAGAEASVEEKRAQLETLRRRIEAIRGDLRQIEAERAALDELAAAGDPRGADPEARAALHGRAATADAQLALLQRAYEQSSELIEKQTSDMLRRQQLEHDAEIARDLYSAFLTKLKETAEQGDVASPDSMIVSQARPSPTPSGPPRALIVVLGAMAGLFGATGLIVLRDMLRGTFKSLEHLEVATNLPVLGVLPHDRRATSPAAALRLVATSRNLALLESARSLRTALTDQSLGRDVRTVMLTSTTPGEGKSSTGLLLAYVSAEEGRKTLVLDCDLRRSSIMANLRERPSVHIRDLVRDHSLIGQAVFYDSVNKFWYASFKSDGISLSNLFTSVQFRDFVDALKQRFDVIYIDTPPVLAATDPRLIARAVDAVLYMVRWDVADQASVKIGLRKIGATGAFVAGVVATGVKSGARTAGDIKAMSYQEYSAYYRS